MSQRCILCGGSDFSLACPANESGLHHTEETYRADFNWRLAMEMVFGRHFATPDEFVEWAKTELPFWQMAQDAANRPGRSEDAS